MYFVPNIYIYNRKQYDNNPRFKVDNIVDLDFDASEKTTQVMFVYFILFSVIIIINLIIML